MNKIKGFKGFDKNFSCRNKQYAENKIFKENITPSACNNGMHYCPMPLDVLKYYPPDGNNIYAEVESLGDIDKTEDKISTNKLQIFSKIKIKKLFELHFDLVFSKIKANKNTTNTSGDYSHANTSGDYSHANTSGDKSHANTSGDKSHANTSGDKSHANTSGDESISCAIGINSKAKASKGWLIITDWRQDDYYKWYIKDIYRAKVGKSKIQKQKIKKNTWYWFENGILKSE